MRNYITLINEIIHLFFKFFIGSNSSQGVEWKDGTSTTDDHVQLSACQE
ncbi:hypothetical protein PL9631_1070066 [Planktothrix paucivesiculata PCC 9631]|uniref:Uncharacterized protein n=1 Tax=Planktothrix paucivesiculata PCC 9631 TaxID=671071 RepID=A0A7Z9BP84_9CYAN|nr:hypothetical protein PL9631_1070066 [Planktothrix paucivesiculata PCC 9631]